MITFFKNNIIYLLFALFFVTCKTDICENVVCNNGIIINNDNDNDNDCGCLCDDFHSGATCTEEVRNNFIGAYTGELICYSQVIKPSGSMNDPLICDTVIINDSLTINVDIIPDSTPRSLISSVGVWILQDANSFLIGLQNYPLNSDNNFIEGNGLLIDDDLTIFYYFEPQFSQAQICTFKGKR